MPLKPLLGDMCDRIRHRGPDGEGHLVDGPVNLGMRRLKIIDLETGDQPVFSEDGSVGVVYNGEIYNYTELREDLIKGGHVFKTQSDTEVIVHQYEEDGERCVEKFRGMFAFVLWDKRARQLLLARDRFGVKPLYVAEKDGRLAFASEMKALRPVPWVDWSWSAPGLRAYLQLGYVPCPMTAYAGVRKFEQGTTEIWQIRPDGWAERRSIRNYWKPVHITAGAVPTFEEASQRLLDVLKESVRLRLRSDVPLGAFLSGGLDSSTVTAIMRQCGVSDIKTFSIGFEDEASNELPYADLVARHLETEHHTHIVTANEAKEVLPLIAGYDEPFADSSAIPTYFVSKLAREHVTVSLSGDGGDELFGGYAQYHRLARLQSLYRWPKSLRRMASTIGTRVIPIGRRGHGLFQRLGRRREEAYLALVTTQPELIWGALSPRLREFLGTGIPDEKTAWHRTFSAISNQASAQLADQRYYLADDILVKVDRSSMAVSLESREPLLDSQLALLANGLPPSYHLRGQEGKRLLKHCMAPYLPSEILHRRKMGFGVPLKKWLLGPLSVEVREGLLTDSSGHFTAKGVQHLIDALKKPHSTLSFNVWVLFCFSQWAERGGL